MFYRIIFFKSKKIQKCSKISNVLELEDKLVLILVNTRKRS